MEDVKDTKNGKVILVGDGACGKTCLLELFHKDSFPSDYIPTVVDNFFESLTIDGRRITLSFWDTAGQEEYNSVRPLAYKDTDLVLLCFSLENSRCLENIMTKWVSEVEYYAPNAGMFLIGLKSDIKCSEMDEEYGFSKLVSGKKPEHLEKDKIALYMECSAKERKGYLEVFQEAAKWVLYNKPTQRPKKQWWFCYCC